MHLLHIKLPLPLCPYILVHFQFMNGVWLHSCASSARRMWWAVVAHNSTWHPSVCLPRDSALWTDMGSVLLTTYLFLEKWEKYKYKYKKEALNFLLAQPAYFLESTAMLHFSHRQMTALFHILSQFPCPWKEICHLPAQPPSSLL